MIRIARLIGFFVSAVGVQLASGVGFVALLLSVALGWRRVRAVWLVVPAIGCAVAAHALFAGVSTGGKVVNSASNLVVDLIVYLVICLIGYLAGALARRVS